MFHWTKKPCRRRHPRKPSRLLALVCVCVCSAFAFKDDGCFCEEMYDGCVIDLAWLVRVQRGYELAHAATRIRPKYHLASSVIQTPRRAQGRISIGAEILNNSYADEKKYCLSTDGSLFLPFLSRSGIILDTSKFPRLLGSNALQGSLRLPIWEACEVKVDGGKLDQPVNPVVSLDIPTRNTTKSRTYHSGLTSATVRIKGLVVRTNSLNMTHSGCVSRPQDGCKPTT